MDIISKKEVLKWFGQNLKRVRKDKGYSQEALAEVAGVDLSYYGAVKRGEKAITILKLSQITSALNIPIKAKSFKEATRCNVKIIYLINFFINSKS